MKKIFTAEQIKRIDNCTVINQGIESVDLMEKASLAVYESLVKLLKEDQKVVVFAGIGNNGGDALAIARMLMIDEYRLKVFLVGDRAKLSKDCRINKDRLERLINISQINSLADIPILSSEVVVIDGLFGSGLNRPLDGLNKEVVKVINASGARVYSIDLPSGLYIGDNSENDTKAIVRADRVFSFQFPKLSLILPQEIDCCQKMTILDIGLCDKCIEDEETDYYYLEKADVANLLQARSTFSHKGAYGHVLMVAGSYGKMGAAVLSARSCLRAGVGLLTVHSPKCGVDVLQTAVPEAMVSVDSAVESVSSVRDVDLSKLTIGVGPGIGKSKEVADLLYELLERYNRPIVIDADALNLIASDDKLKEKIPPHSILTPHPVEFERLIGLKCHSSYERLQYARDFANKHKVYIVLKGAYSAVVTPEKQVYFNSTGNPGMATAGSGDVLTGIITSLLAQQYSPLNSALLGVYLHGLAGDLAVKAKSQQGMIASDITEYIGRAYNILKF